MMALDTASEAPRSGAGGAAGLDPELEQRAAEDPLVRFILQSWRQVLFTALAVAAVFYAVNVFQETREAERGRAGDILARVQREFTMLEELEFRRERLPEGEASVEQAAELDAQIAASRGRLNAIIDALAQARSPYSEIARLYRGMAAAHAGDIDGARAALTAQDWRQLPAEEGRMTVELGALRFARLLLDTPEGVAEGRRILEQLAREGRYVAASAARSLSAIASSEEERAEASEIIEQLLLRQPEQRPLLESELNRLQSAA